MRLLSGIKQKGAETNSSPEGSKLQDVRSCEVKLSEILVYSCIHNWPLSNTRCWSRWVFYLAHYCCFYEHFTVWSFLKGNLKRALDCCISNMGLCRSKINQLKSMTFGLLYLQTCAKDFYLVIALADWPTSLSSHRVAVSCSEW